MKYLSLERRLGDAVRRRLPRPVAEFAMFGLKQGWACLFGGLMFAGLLVSDALWRDNWRIARYDALFLFGLTIQALFLTFKLESWREARVILLFHVTSTATWVYAG